jgi:hypothetical protein
MMKCGAVVSLLAVGLFCGGGVRGIVYVYDDR